MAFNTLTFGTSNSDCNREHRLAAALSPNTFAPTHSMHPPPQFPHGQYSMALGAGGAYAAVLHVRMYDDHGHEIASPYVPVSRASSSITLVRRVSATLSTSDICALPVSQCSVLLPFSRRIRRAVCGLCGRVGSASGSGL
jgi:hypothetical protein